VLSYNSIIRLLVQLRIKVANGFCSLYPKNEKEKKKKYFFYTNNFILFLRNRKRKSSLQSDNWNFEFILNKILNKWNRHWSL